jgi:hypothetical protein
MPVLQPVYRTGPRNRSLARNLIAGAQQPAAHVLKATEECSDYDASVTVVACKSKSVQIKCGVALVPGQLYWMVRSAKFTARWYVITRNVKNNNWMCSSRDERVTSYCIGQVEAYRSARSAKKAA